MERTIMSIKRLEEIKKERREARHLLVINVLTDLNCLTDHNARILHKFALDYSLALTPEEAEESHDYTGTHNGTCPRCKQTPCNSPSSCNY